jgi:formylglycine-generating enzyme required for sulfatase activity
MTKQPPLSFIKQESLKRFRLMKWLVLVICLLLLFSFTRVRKKKFIPPGTVPITENFFADETEISNLSWMEYELWTAKKYGPHSPEHLAALPDTLVWRDKKACNEPYVEYYYRHLAYRNYPVVGISYEQALAFCRWRTERVKEYWSIKNKTELFIAYRLPTREEWELLSNNAGGISFKNKGRDEKGRATFNFLRAEDDTLGTADFMSDNADVTAPVYSYWKNPFGLYNTIGNVAEMLSEKGICKGGSWSHRLENCRPGKNISYDKPESWLGFRCVCDLQKKPEPCL